MTHTLSLLRSAFVFVVALSFALPFLHAAGRADMKTVTPEELIQILKSKKESQPLLFYVGPRSLYTQAHIPNSEAVGQGATPEGLQNLRTRVRSLPKNTAIVLYCGCCPWTHCPNINPAYDALVQMGFTNVKVMYIMNNFGADWVDKGYPVEKGQ